MSWLFALISVWQAVSAQGTPSQSDAMPSVYPLVGPEPPQGPARPPGPSQPLNPPEPSAAPAFQVKGVGKYWTGWQSVQKFFPFGDSYTTTGFQPNGSQPSPDFPLGNPAFPGLTSSNGPNYIDFMTLKYNASLVETYNFAIGGATVDSDIVPSYLPNSDFRAQVNYEFFPYYVNQPDVEWTPANSLFSAFFGINDVGNSYSAQNATINGDIFAVYGGLVGQLYNAGARNFLFLNVPPVNLSPGTVALGPTYQTLEAADIANFNQDLEQLAQNLSAYPDTTVFLYDTNTLFNQILQNPTSFQQTSQLMNLTTYCEAYENGTPEFDTFDPSCGVPVNEYFWLNTLHPTYPAHDALAAQIVQELDGTDCIDCP